MMKSFGPFNNWVAFMDVDEYFQLNATHAAAVESGESSLLQLLDAELAIPRASDGFLCHSLQFQMWQVLLLRTVPEDYGSHCLLSYCDEPRSRGKSHGDDSIALSNPELTTQHPALCRRCSW